MRRLKELSPRERERAMDVCIRFYTPPIFANEFAAAAGDTKHNTEKSMGVQGSGVYFYVWQSFFETTSTPAFSCLESARHIKL